MARKSEKIILSSVEFKKLSDTELKYMRFIWQYPTGVSSEEIYSNFSQARGTISTVLYNISEKGYVDKIQKGLHHFYQAKISEEEYNQAILKQQLENVFGSCSMEKLIAAFCGKQQLNESQKEKVKILLQELEDEVDNE